MIHAFRELNFVGRKIKVRFDNIGNESNGPDSFSAHRKSVFD